MRWRYAAAAATVVTGGARLGMTMARANWRAVNSATASSIAPSRRWTCQSSGRRMVRRFGSVMAALSNSA
jgi:hypothetical protein